MLIRYIGLVLLIGLAF